MLFGVVRTHAPAQEAVLELQHNVSADSLSRIAELNENLKSTVATLLGSGVEAVRVAI